MTDDSDAQTSGGGTQPVGYPAWLGEAERRLIEQTFEAFAWRAKPLAVVSEREVRAGALETVEMLTGVAARDVGDELFDAAFPQPLFVSLSLTPEANLYYTPVVVSRCVREVAHQRRRRQFSSEPVLGLMRSMLSQFRRHPVHLGRPVAEWPRLVDVAADKDAVAEPEVLEWADECGTDFVMDVTRLWLMIDLRADDTDIWSWGDTLDFLSMMTTAERQALVAFFDYLAASGTSRNEKPSLASAKALLAGRGVMDVLCIRTDAECIEIADVLQALETRHPQDFPPQKVAPVKNLLRDIAAGRRSPDTKLGW